MGRVRASFPRFRRQAGAARIELTDDDEAILRHVFRHRFVSADDLYRLFPNRSAGVLSRRLTGLFRNEYLDRPVAQIDRYREGGSRPFVYGLGNAGARYLKQTLGMPVGATDWRSRNRTYTRENLDHTLAVSRFLIDIEIACRARGDFVPIHFEEILAAAPGKTRSSPNPARWSVPVQFNGTRSSVNLIPDAIFGLRFTPPDGPAKEAYFLLEVDRGTMTIVPAEHIRESDAFLYRATILRKFLTYAESWRQNLHKSHLGIAAARVLTLTTSTVRVDAMRAAALEYVVRKQKLAPGVFLFGVQDAGADPLSTAFVDCAGRQTNLAPRQAVMEMEAVTPS
jgi:Replication-relaxation